MSDANAKAIDSAVQAGGLNPADLAKAVGNIALNLPDEQAHTLYLASAMLVRLAADLTAIDAIATETYSRLRAERDEALAR